MLETIQSLVIPLCIGVILVIGLYREVKVYDEFLCGAKETLSVCISLIPPLVGLVCAVSMIRQSGALELIAHALSPMCSFLNIPADIIPLSLMRPVSGSASLAILKDTMQTHGVDSFTGMTAQVISGSTETTFYAITVYFAASHAKKTHQTLSCALMADFTAIVMAIVMVKQLF